MNKKHDFKAKMVPQAKIWTMAFFIILISQLYATLFLFIVISFNQYFGVDSPKCAKNIIKWKKNRYFKAKTAPEAQIWSLAFFIILKSQLYTTFFLFILISFNQYFGVENPKCAKNMKKWKKIVILRLKRRQRRKFGHWHFS